MKFNWKVQGSLAGWVASIHRLFYTEADWQTTTAQEHAICKDGKGGHIQLKSD